MRALRLLPSFAFSLAIAAVAGDQDMSLVSSLDLKEGAPILPSLTSLVSVPWETYISSLAGLEQGTSELLKQGLSPECGTACSLGLAGLAGATIYSLYSRGVDRNGINRRLGVQRPMSVAESLFQRVAKGIERMQARNYQRSQIARNAMVQRSDAFWSRIREAQRRDSAARRSMVEGIRSRVDQMRNFFSSVQERQDSQVQQNKAALSSWVNGMVAKARSLSNWDRARKERNKEAIRRMIDPERVFSNRVDTVEEPRGENAAWDFFGKAVDFVLGRSGEEAEEAQELPVW